MRRWFFRIVLLSCSCLPNEELRQESHDLVILQARAEGRRDAERQAKPEAQPEKTKEQICEEITKAIAAAGSGCALELQIEEKEKRTCTPTTCPECAKLEAKRAESKTHGC